jgi:hypothetical protein
MPSAKAVTTVPQVAFTGTVEGNSVRLVDAPGLFDPDRSNEETLIQLTAMLREEILGFDTIFHVVRMGRLQENDKKLPRLVFETLMTPKSDREELLKRYRLLVTHCDSSDDDGISAVEAMAQFRGQLIETLPEEFRDVDIIFVKNNARCKSDYNGARRIRREIVHGHLVPCRENRSVVYVPPRLSDILEDEANQLREKMERTMGCTALRKLDLADVLHFSGHPSIFFPFCRQVRKVARASRHGSSSGLRSSMEGPAHSRP